jgi:lipoprotein-anchoring transpeptidase ErfK/SrfK
MSALRVLGFCYLATASLFALAFAAADPVELRYAMDAAGSETAHRFAETVTKPLQAFVRAEDERFFDPPAGPVAVAVNGPGPNDARTYAHATVPPVPQKRLVDQPPVALAPPMLIAPDLPQFREEDAASSTTHDVTVLQAARAEAVEARLEQSLTPELRQNFDLFLFVSKAAKGPAAQRLYVFRKGADGILDLVYDWAASTGREEYEISPLGRHVFTATPGGFYQLDPGRMYRHYTSHAWDGEMPYAMFFNWERAGMKTGIAIHGASDNSIAQLGKRASAGCVHISPEHAELLYRMIRADYRGRVPRFAYDASHETMSNRGELMRDATGHLEMMDGYRVLIDIEDFSGRSLMATLY